MSAQSAHGTYWGHGQRRSYTVVPAAACRQPDQLGPELAIGSEPDAPSGGQVIPAAGSVTSTTHQPVLLTLTERAMQDRLPGGVILQDADLAGGASRPKRATVHRIQHRELNPPEHIAGFHSSKLSAGRACLTARSSAQALTSFVPAQSASASRRRDIPRREEQVLASRGHGT
jgi:hypothetical protein